MTALTEQSAEFAAEVERRIAAAETSVTALASRVTALENGPTVPPPSGTWPPAYADFSDDFAPAPEPRWSWWLNNGNTSFPNAGAALVSDGAGGNAVRLTSPSVGGSGQLSSFYDGSGAFGQQGQRQLGQVDIRRVNQDQFIWVWEWHENAGVGVNSCAVGLNPNRTLRVQVSGGSASGHQYTTVNDTEALGTGWYALAWDITWSTTAGRFKLTLNGRTVVDVSRPTLLIRSNGQPDNVVVGGYCYTPPGSNGAQVMEFRRVAIGV